MVLLHHRSPFFMPSSVAHIDSPGDALGVAVMFDRALDTLLMHHVSLGIVRIVPERPSEFSA